MSENMNNKENKNVIASCLAELFGIINYNGVDLNKLSQFYNNGDQYQPQQIEMYVNTLKSALSVTSVPETEAFIAACNEYIVHNFPAGTNTVKSLEDVSNFIAYITAQLNNANKAFAVQTPAAFASADKVAQAIAVRNKFLEQRVAELEAENSSLKAQLANK